MKTLFTLESKIQGFLVGLFLVVVIICLKFKSDESKITFTTIFFSIAIFQYLINVIKFFSADYSNTNLRKVYMILSTFVVVSLLIFILSHNINPYDSNPLKDFIPLFFLIYMVLSPILITFSLVIGFEDKKRVSTQKK